MSFGYLEFPGEMYEPIGRLYLQVPPHFDAVKETLTSTNMSNACSDQNTISGNDMQE